VGSIRCACMGRNHLFRCTTVMVTSEFRRKVLLCTRVNKSCSFRQIHIASTSDSYFHVFDARYTRWDEEEMDTGKTYETWDRSSACLRSHSFGPRAVALHVASIANDWKYRTRTLVHFQNGRKHPTTRINIDENMLQVSFHKLFLQRLLY
jgi:hypothetical protein